ncbi:unnamed protein product [Protopolystoma xenopodis]|uniref:Uncharacterized protein n=1 Tax=Protopolystoma xenopodis TaxID=117903 RepID=A0A448X726_9PLAT|nr:unnamed protein product [Protopolystoma xenopodis]
MRLVSRPHMYVHVCPLVCMHELGVRVNEAISYRHSSPPKPIPPTTGGRKCYKGATLSAGHVYVGRRQPRLKETQRLHRRLTHPHSCPQPQPRGAHFADLSLNQWPGPDSKQT